MDKIYNIRYVDAYYSHAQNIGETKLSLHDAHGYVEKSGDNIIIIFIKKRNTNNNEIIRTKQSIVKGLVIPNTALVSVVEVYKNDILKNVTIGAFVAVIWRDVVYVANLPRYDCSIMRTEGVMFRIEKDHIVLKNPETTRIYPEPIKNHPEGNPATYLIIPISFVTEIIDAR